MVRAILLSLLVSFSGGLSFAERSSDGLIGLYDFAGSNGDLVIDRAKTGTPLNLRIKNPGNVRRKNGSLEITKSTVIQSEKTPSKLVDSIRKTGAITIEVWLRSAKLDQSGPARIVTLSKDTSDRNFTLGQDGNRYDVRFRTKRTDRNGLPSLSSSANSLVPKLTHVVYTKNRSGQAQIFINGKRNSNKTVSGDLSNWGGSFRLSLGNELTGERSWLGTFYLLAIFNRDLSAQEITSHFREGLETTNLSKAIKSDVTTTTLTSGANRVRGGLQAFYNFSEGKGQYVRDRSGAGKPADLHIANPKTVKWQKGSLLVVGESQLRTDEFPKRITTVVRESGAITIEAWIQPARTNLSGPARIVTLSKNSSERNFTLGQDGDKFDVRFRTTKTGANGNPSLSSPAKSLKTALMHVVYTRSRSGQARLYLGGEKVSEKMVPGDTSNWVGEFRLALADEITYGRHWLGAYHLVAIYSRDLSANEVIQNFKAGANGTTLTKGRSSVDLTLEKNAHHFETQIAPLLARKCLECHDSISKKGKLDLSRKETAFADPDIIAKGKSANSLLWESIDSDEMPDEGDPLSVTEKKLIKDWIDTGATWSLPMIDPATYTYDSRAGETWVQRLTVSEYIETVRSAVGVDIGKEARALLPPDLRADGFSNTAYNLNVDLKHVDAYSKLAALIVNQIDAEKFAKPYAKNKQLTDKNMRDLISRMGKQIFRGSLDDHEIVSLRGISTTVASAGGDFRQAVGFILEAMLQSPRFIYRMENQRGDGTAWPVSEYEMASRMSYILWGGPPDKDLFRAAETGNLTDRGQIKSQIERMMNDPRAVNRSLQFVSEWLDLTRLDNLNPSPDKFPKWESVLANDMREETLAFFKDVVWRQKRPLTDLLNARVTHITPRLAKHYGMNDFPSGINDKEQHRFELSNTSGRGGLLTQGSVLTMGGDDASMVTRGLFVLHDILRGVVSDPPPDADTTPVPSTRGLTHRGVAEKRIADKACGACHTRFEPLAFGLEKFDGLGTRSEEDEHGNKLREDGEILFPGAGKTTPYQSTIEMMDLLAANDRVAETLTWKVAQFALGRPLVEADARTLSAIHQSAKKQGGTYADVITAIVLSDLVRTTRTESGSE